MQIPKQNIQIQPIAKETLNSNNKSNQNLMYTNNIELKEKIEKNSKIEPDEGFLLKIMDNFFSDLENFNIQKDNNLCNLLKLLRRKYDAENNNYKISIMTIISKYSKIWKTFCLSIEEKLKSILEEKLPNKNNEANNINLYIEKNEKLNKYLKEKQDEINLLKGTLEKEMKFNQELQINISDLNKKILNQKHSENQENQLYNYKQSLRDYNLLLNENKGLREELNALNKDISAKKEKEVKIMKILFMLTKRGVPVEEMIGKEMLMKKDIAEEKSPEFVLENSKLIENSFLNNDNHVNANKKVVSVAKINLQNNSKAETRSVESDYDYSKNNLKNLNTMEKELLKTYNNMGNENVYDDPNYLYNKKVAY